MLQLIEPSLEYERAWREIIEEFKEYGEPIIPYSLDYGTDEYVEFLKITQNMRQERVPNGMVRASTYFFTDTVKIFGAINIRWELNEYLENVGGHIGYGVRPSERKKGYAVQMLLKALEICKEKGLKKVLITCDVDNVASQKTVIQCGGVLEDIREFSGESKMRYWIVLK